MSKTAAGITGDSYQRTTFPQVQKRISEQTMYSFQKAINLQANQCVMLNGLASDSGSSNSLVLINPKMVSNNIFSRISTSCINPTQTRWSIIYTGFNLKRVLMEIF